jgi:hypothetical protein
LIVKASEGTRSAGTIHVASALLRRLYPCNASADLRRSSASVEETPFGESRVIFPRTCSGSNRNVIPVSAATCLTTVWMSAFSKEMAPEGVAEAGPAPDQKRTPRTTPVDTSAPSMDTFSCGLMIPTSDTRLANEPASRNGECSSPYAGCSGEVEPLPLQLNKDST